MPAAMAFVLTHRLACAALMLVMLMGAVWIPVLLQGLAPVLVLLITTVGLAIHMLVPALVALVTFGGGIVFASHVAALAAVGSIAVTGFALMPGVVVFVLYGLIPILGAALMMRSGGIRQSAEYMALGLGAITLLGLAVAAMTQNVTMQVLVGQMLAPMFEGVQGQMPASEQEAVQMLEQARQLMVAILPGLMALGLWFAWWGNVVLARSVASKYNFYQGDNAGLLALHFGKPVAYVFLVLLVAMNLGAGSLQYIAANAAILVGGMLATQGIAVAHSWLKAKNMMFSIAMLYLMLIIWSVMIIPFVVIGLVDIWFDYRRKIPVVGG